MSGLYGVNSFGWRLFHASLGGGGSYTMSSNGRGITQFCL
jgi:hypothetical protein